MAPKRNKSLTGVLLVSHPGWVNHRLRFGAPTAQFRLSPFRELAVFSEGDCFGYIRWQANFYGTQDWRLIIAQPVGAGSLTRAPGIFPGAEILFAVRGKTRVKRALILLDDLERDAQDLVRITPAYWRHVQVRFDTLDRPHAFSELQAVQANENRR